eukprot:TRINITY_DN2151_c0_g1_i2.p1 TRINITY_DN2151_c0_g1~~TRINITY_DN2151_c0_g1_i2.p1  ORF type:complete len:205 (-),score=41.93 TRINITY_DN2151_c0_g1_i2:34-648(-)
MNIQQFVVPEVTVRAGHETTDVLCCLLHSVMFNRAFGLVTPKETTIEYLDFVYVCVDDVVTDEAIRTNVDNFLNNLDLKKDNYPKRGKLVLSFYERKWKKIWWKRYQERICFEQWIFSIQVLKEGEPIPKEIETERLANLQTDLRQVMVYILQAVNEKNTHIPPLKPSQDLTPFPYEITIPTAAEGWGAGIWNIVNPVNASQTK